MPVESIVYYRVHLSLLEQNITVIVFKVVRLSLSSPVAAGVSRRPSNRVLDKRRLAGIKYKKEGIGDDA